MSPHKYKHYYKLQEKKDNVRCKGEFYHWHLDNSKKVIKIKCDKIKSIYL